MINSKNTTVKTIVMTTTTILMLVVSSAFSTKPEERKNADSISKRCKLSTVQDFKYFVVHGDKVTAYGDKDEIRMVSNVVFVDEKYCNTSSHVQSEFGTFVEAYYSNKGVKNTIAFGFYTRDEALAKRRKIIAEYNNDSYITNTILVNDFTVTCKHY